MRRLSAATLALLMIAGLVGCSEPDSGSDPANPDQVELVTWWTSGPDGLALDKLTTEFRKVHPGIQVIDASVAGDGGETARAAIVTRLETGNAPDIIQASAGAALTRTYAEGVLLDLSDLYAESGLAERIRPDLLNLLGSNGGPVAVPVDVYRANVLWIDRAQLQENGYTGDDRLADLDDWLADLQRLRDGGFSYPLAVGDARTQVQLFEGVLLSRLGATGYQRLWDAPASWLESSTQTAIADYARLLEFADPRSAARDQRSTVNEVVLGDAVYVVMTDHAERQFQSAGAVFGRDYDAVAVPGSDGVFAIAADTFAIPSDAVHPDAARAWLAVAVSAAGQRAFTVAKGTLPISSEVTASDYPPYQRAGIAALRDDVLVPSLSQGVAIDADWLAEITSALAQFRADGGATRLSQRLAAAGQSYAGR